jgi:dipeptidase E
LPTDGPVVVITTAAERLADRDEVVASLVDRMAGGPVVTVDPADDGTTAIDVAAMIAVAGGDPFHLLDTLRRSGADRAIIDRVAAGVPYLGVSAGAVVTAPSLVPLTAASPFTAPDGLELRGLGVSPVLVLPHHDRPGRAARHVEALRRHGRDVRLECLRDGDVAVVADRRDPVVHLGPGGRRRRARSDDAAAVAAVYLEAARTAWAPFLGQAALAELSAPADRWRTRIDEHHTVGTFVVAEDDDGIAAFAATRPCLDPDLRPDGPSTGTVGELDLFYAAPRTWGRGLARQLHHQALLDLLAAGHEEAVLWTEERNVRAVAFYGRQGWRPDGATRARRFVGGPLVEARRRIDLATAAARG